MNAEGVRLAGYLLETRKGEGPFGEVWEAVDPDGQPVVLKRLKPELTQDRSLTRAFQQVRSAVAAHSAVEHPYVARALDVVVDPDAGLYAVVSERSPGRPLAQLDVSHAAQDGEDWAELTRLLFYFEELGEALNWIHRAGLVHGNLKPNNAIVQRGDFGLVPRLLDSSWSALGVGAQGSPFVSPEQFAGHYPTPASDQWSYGTMLSRMLTSKRPDRSFGAVPEALVDALQRCRSREVTGRFPTMREAVDQIRAARSEMERASQVPRRRSASTTATKEGGHEPPVPTARPLIPDTGDVEPGPAPPAEAPAPPTPPAVTGARPWEEDVDPATFKPNPAPWILLPVVAVLLGVMAALWLSPVPEEEEPPAPPALLE